MNKKFIIEKRFNRYTEDMDYSISGKHLQTCGGPDIAFGYELGLEDLAKLSGNEVEYKIVRPEPVAESDHD